MTYEMRECRCHSCGVEFPIEVPVGAFYEVHCPACVAKAKRGILRDGVHVAEMFVSESELTNLLAAVRSAAYHASSLAQTDLFNRMAADLAKLRKEAFGT